MRHVRFGANNGSSVSFDRGVGTGEQRWRDFDTSLEIDDQLRLSRLLNGHISHFRPSQQLRDLTSALTKTSERRGP
jgi:hypothetical protein